MTRSKPVARAAWLAWALFFLSGAAHANCTGLRFGLLPPIVSWTGAGAGYNVFDRADRMQAVTFTVTKLDGVCPYFITAATELGGNAAERAMASGGQRLAFNIFTNSSRTNPLRDLPVAAANDMISGSFAVAGSATNTHVHYFWIAPGQVVTPGAFIGIAQLKLFQGTLANNSLVQIANVKYLANVRAVAELSVVDPGRSFDPSGGKRSVDFGFVHRGQKAELALRVRGNNGFDVTIQSQNAGTMRPPGSGDPSFVPYTLTLAGRALGLAGGGTPAANLTAATTAEGVAFPLEITVGDLAHADAGAYSDVLTITVIPK